MSDSIPTETLEEKEALDAIEQKSPYDVGAHCSVQARISGKIPAQSNAARECESIHEVKPAFTKVMQEAGCPIKSGQQFIRKGFNIGSNKVFYVGAHPLDEHLHVVWEVTNLNKYVASYALPIGEILPIQTDREKAIEGALSKIVVPVNIDAVKMVLGATFDCGLLKC